MKAIKILVGIAVVLVIILVVAVFIVGSHLGDIVKAAMENIGPKMTKTTLTVDSVDVSLLGGSAGVKNLVLGNPDGYKAAQSISVSNATVSLVPGSVLSDKIVIRSVEVRAPQITFEGNPLGMNNLKQIMANVDGAPSSGASPAASSTAPADVNAPASTSSGPAKPAKKLEVDDFLITGATVHANLTGLINQEVTLPIPDIHLTDLGKGTDGITVADLTKKVLNEITTDTIQELVKSATNLGQNAISGVKGAAADAANGVLQGAGMNATNSVDKLKQGLGGLFGK